MALELPLQGRVSQLSTRTKAGIAAAAALAAIASIPTHATVGPFALTQVGRHAEQAVHVAAPPVPVPVPVPRQAPPPPPPAPTVPQQPPQPFTLYDSTTPGQIPAGAQAVAVYADGSYAATPSQVAGKPYVLWIDANASDPKANVLDVEQGDAQPAQVAGWVAAHDTQTNTNAVVYTYQSQWPAVQASVASLPQADQSRVKYWIADPTGVPHNVNGAAATQWNWTNTYDQSTVLPGT